MRCIVRREHAVAYIKRGPSLEQFADKVEFAVVPDNTISGAYDAALEGATYVVHIAGVWPMPVRLNRELTYGTHCLIDVSSR